MLCATTAMRNVLLFLNAVEPVTLLLFYARKLVATINTVRDGSKERLMMMMMIMMMMTVKKWGRDLPSTTPGAYDANKLPLNAQE
jgi:hypothetical protein